MKTNSETELKAFFAQGVRPGDSDPVPACSSQASATHPRGFSPEPAGPGIETGVRSGDCDTGSPAAAKPRFAASEDDKPFQAPTGRDPAVADPATANDGSPESCSWLRQAASLVAWLFVLWLGWQVGGAFRSALSLPAPFRWFAVTALTAVFAVAAAWVWRLARAFVSADARQWNAKEKTEKARLGLQAHYERLASGERRVAFERRFPKGEQRDAALGKLDALGICAPGMTQDWWVRQAEFETFLEERAKRIVDEHALLVAAKTAASPWKIVDIAAVFYNGTRMVEKVAQLYGRACSGPQAFRLALRWGFNLYVAGQLGDISAKGAATALGALGSFFGDQEAQSTTASQLAKGLPLAGPLLAKAAEGAANGLLCRRLGHQAIETFRPVSASPQKTSPSRRNRHRSFSVALAATFAAAAFAVSGVSALLSERASVLASQTPDAVTTAEPAAPVEATPAVESQIPVATIFP